MKTKELTEKQIDRAYDDFINNLIPFGSMDIRFCVQTALEVNIDMDKLVDIISDYCKETETDLFNSKNTVDIIAILNDHIIQEARNEIDEKLNIDIQNDFDTYFFSNYIDCPLQYSEECKKTIMNALKKKKIALKELSECTQYVLNEMGLA